jgi:hypothetical protein
VVVTEQRSGTCSGALCPIVEPLLEGAAWLYEKTLGRLDDWAERQGVKGGAKARQYIESQEPSEHLLQYRREMTKDLPPEILAADQGTQQLGTKGQATAAELGEAGTRAAVKHVVVAAATTAIAVGIAKAGEAAEALAASGARPPVALGKSKDLLDFRDAAGGKVYPEWFDAGLTAQPFSRDRFGTQFHRAAGRAQSIRFNLEGVDVEAAVSMDKRLARSVDPIVHPEIGGRGLVTEWELRQIMQNPRLFGKTEFYWGGSTQFTAEEVASMGIRPLPRR